MTREEFIENYLATERAIIREHTTEIRVFLALIGSIYDLQQQIAELQERLIE